MKRVVLIFGLIFLAYNIPAAMWVGMFMRMHMIREQVSILKVDSLMAESGNVHHQLTCALRYWGREEYMTARHFLNRAVAENNDTAMVYLAEMDYYGYGLSKPDANSALRHANKALARGNKFSYFIIGKNYYDAQKYEEAFKCFELVPDDSPNIRLNNYYIAKCFRYGRGVRQDVRKSVDYLKKANMAEPVDWWEKHFPRIKELNDLRKIAEILKIETNPELSKRCFLSSTKV